jgi:hypothetical protein
MTVVKGSNLEDIKVMSEANLEVGTWTSPKGIKHVSLTRVGKYRKNIAIPVDVLPVVLRALEAEGSL